MDLAPLDRWALAAFGRLAKEVREAFRTFEFHRATQALHGFCQLELSGRYFEIVKDRLYCDALDSPRRRSCRHTCRELAMGLCRLLAPVMSFTADEAWEQIPGVEGSVHEQVFPEVDALDVDPAWEVLWGVRESAHSAMEPLRAAKSIGTSLDAEAAITLSGQEWELLDAIKEPLDDLLVVSGIDRLVGDVTPGAYHVTVGAHDGPKCPRCWNHKGGHGTGEDAALCARCASVMEA
jgi:isoleucyl-tRNA synthetase